MKGTCELEKQNHFDIDSVITHSCVKACDKTLKSKVKSIFLLHHPGVIPRVI